MYDLLKMFLITEYGYTRNGAIQLINECDKRLLADIYNLFIEKVKKEKSNV